MTPRDTAPALVLPALSAPVPVARTAPSRPLALGPPGGLGPVAALGDYVAVAVGAGGEIVVVDPLAPEGTGRRVVGRHGARVTALVASGGLVFSAGADGRVLGHTLGAGSALSVVVGCHRAGVTAASCAGAGLATAGHDGQVLGWGGDAPALLARHRGGVEALALLATGTVVTAGRDGRLLVHDPAAGGRPVELHQRRCRREITLAVTPLAGGGLVTAGGQDGALRRWDLHEAGRPDAVGVHGTWVLALVTPDADSVAAVGGDRVTFWDLRSGEAVRVGLGEGVHATSAAVVPGGRLAIACADGTVRLVGR